MSSFAYLKHLPVDYLKIDGGFVKDMADDPIDRAMVEAINNVGHVMGKKTIAEFVDSDRVLAALQEIGVDFAQGYGVAKPRPFGPRLQGGKRRSMSAPQLSPQSSRRPPLILLPSIDGSSRAAPRL